MNSYELPIYVETLQSRLNIYKDDNSDYARGYKDAVGECVNDILFLSRPLPIPDGEEQSYIDDMAADDYISSIENHERLAV